MKGLRLIAVSFILLLIFACFISVPVFGENPWDADGGGSSSDTNSDSTGTGGEEINDLITADNVDPDPDGLSGILFWLSYRVVTGFLLDSQATSTSHQVTAGKADSGKPAITGS